MTWSSTFTIVSFLVGIVGLYLTFKSYKKNKVNVINVFSESSANLVLGNIGDLKVLYNDTSYENISAHEFVIFNDGSDGIDGDDIVENHPIRFYVEDDSNILDFSVVSETTERSESKVVRKSKKEVLVDFIWLEKKHGIRIKMLTDTTDVPRVSGKIKKHAPLNLISDFNSSNSSNLVSLVLGRFIDIKDDLKGTTLLLTTVLVFLILLIFFTSFNNYSKAGDAYVLVPREILLEDSISGKAEYQYIDSKSVDDFNLQMKLINFRIAEVVEYYKKLDYEVKLVSDKGYLSSKNLVPSRVNEMVVGEEVVQIELIDNVKGLADAVLRFLYAISKTILYALVFYFAIFIIIILYHTSSIKNISKYYPLLDFNERQAIELWLKGSMFYRFIFKLIPFYK